RNARMVDVDRPVKDGDEVLIDYSGSVDGVKFDGGTAEKQTLVIGSKTFIPGFEEQLIGMSKGEEKDINVKFPDEYRAENLKGKDSVFHIKLHEIKFKELPAIDDDFAKDVSEFDTLDEYKADIRKNLTEEKTKKAEAEEENALVEMIVKDAKVEIPDAMVETQIDAYVEDFGYTLMYQGLNLDDYLKYTNNTKEKLRETYREKAQVGVKTRLVMEAIIKAEELKADAKSVEAKIKQLAKEINQDYKEYKETISEQHLDYIKNEVLSEKLIAFLKTENTIA
ncbi:MAG: trigger factor, partial [Clostridia bacterium]|nr:trigger factor [Clostridia bacterium]